MILNGMARDYFQRENLIKGLKNTEDEDLIIVSDLDEIPNIDNLKLIKSKIILLFLNNKCFTTNLIYFTKILFGLDQKL